MLKGISRGPAVGLAPRRPLAFRAAQQRRAVRQRLVVVLGRGQQQLRQLLVAQHVEDETGQHQRGDHGRGIENAPKALPSLALRVEKYLADQACLVSITSEQKPLQTVYAIHYESYGTHPRESIDGAPAASLRSRRPPARPRSLSAAAALAAGLVLRLCMLKNLFQVNGDSLIYGDLAKNLLLHGHYAFTGCQRRIGSHPHPPARLPALPRPLLPALRNGELLFRRPRSKSSLNSSAACCWPTSPPASRRPRLAPGARHATLWLAALCPFTASYAAAPLAETPTLFALALALWAMARFHRPAPAGQAPSASPSPSPSPRCSVPMAPWSPSPSRPRCFVSLGRRNSSPNPAPKARPHRRSSASCSPSRPLPPGPPATGTSSTSSSPSPRAWPTIPVKTPTPAGSAGPKPGASTSSPPTTSTGTSPTARSTSAKLPSRAFDSPAQYAETAALAADYNAHGYDLTPAIDARFAALARQRIAAHPLRYYLWLPLGRLADMTLRPRVENLNIDLDWWVYAHHHSETLFSWVYAALNALYLVLAAVGLWLRPRFWKAMLAYILLRSALLLTVEAPEARYTLEFFPMLFALAGIALSQPPEQSISARAAA